MLLWGWTTSLPNETQQDPLVTNSSAATVLGRGMTRQQHLRMQLWDKAHLFPLRCSPSTHFLFGKRSEVQDMLLMLHHVMAQLLLPAQALRIWETPRRSQHGEHSRGTIKETSVDTGRAASETCALNTLPYCLFFIPKPMIISEEDDFRKNRTSFFSYMKKQLYHKHLCTTIVHSFS